MSAPPVPGVPLQISRIDQGGARAIELCHEGLYSTRGPGADWNAPFVGRERVSSPHHVGIGRARRIERDPDTNVRRWSTQIVEYTSEGRPTSPVSILVINASVPPWNKV